jgi:hypothetical protein
MTGRATGHGGATHDSADGRPTRAVSARCLLTKAWRSACRKAGYTGTLLHDLRRPGVRAMVRSGTPEPVASLRLCDGGNLKRYGIVSAQDLKDARDRRAQFGHNQAAKVVSVAR